MSRLNVYIDGTWLFNQCGAGKSLPNATEAPAQRFSLDFSKLNHALLEHVQKQDRNCIEIGEAYFVTSIFTLPSDLDTWPSLGRFTQENIDRIKKSAFAREAFVRSAVDGGYKGDAIFRPLLQDFMLQKVIDNKYQEKQVDTAVVALLVRAAITQPGNYHVVITGDSDILPAIKVAYPEYTDNVVVATTHPDELKAQHRQTSFSLLDFSFSIPAFFLQDNAEKIISGTWVYRCAECGKVFVLSSEIPKKARPYCIAHRHR